MIGSILESIVRVEERIFINQQQAKIANNKDNSNQQNNQLETIQTDVNPFLPLKEDNNKSSNEEDNKSS